MQSIKNSPRHRGGPLAAAVLFGCSLAAEAAPLTVVNAGFEDVSGEFVFNEFTFGALNGWDLYDPANITSGGAGNTFYIGTLTPFEADPLGAPGVFTNIPNGAPQGQRVGIAFNFASGGGLGEYGFQQTLAATLAANTRYTLEVDVINIASGTARSGDFFDLSGFPAYRIELLAGNEVIAADDNSLAGSLAEGGVGTSTLVFTSATNPVALGQNLRIRLINLNVPDASALAADLEVDFDNVRLDAVSVPLPPMVPALALACAGLVMRRRRV